MCIRHCRRPKVIRSDVLHASCLDSVCQLDVPDFQSASDTKLKVSGTLDSLLCMNESRTCVNFSVVNELVVPVL